MVILGQLALVLAFAVAIANAFVGAAAGHGRTLRLALISRQGVYVLFGLIAIASACLMYAFLTHDFSVRYVFGRSDTRMPLGYLMAAFWGGQEGSLLFWVGITAILAALASWFNRDRLPAIMPWFHAVISFLLAGFLFILVFVTNPFDTYVIVDAPLDGTGLKAALRDPLMTIHPPMLLSGYASFAIPWAFAMAALLARDGGSDWLKATRRWTLISWLFLSLGNLLGGMWAYRELGWGGYWAWDPVENAGLLPWLTATAFLHSAIIQEQRGMLKRWNISLVITSFLLTLFGTFITRSGLIDSVHTFAESEIGDYFFWLLVVMTVVSVLAAWRAWDVLESEHRIERVASRESMFLANNWLFVGMTFVVFWGTIFPKVREMITGMPVAIGPPWFNRFMTPLGILLLALIVLGTVFPWRRATRSHLLRNFAPPLVAALVATPLAVVAWWWVRGHAYGVDPFTSGAALALVIFFLVVLNVAVIGWEFQKGIRARRKARPQSWFAATADLMGRHRRRYGGYIVHLGIALIFFAFTGNVLKVDKQLVLPRGESVELADYVVTFERFDIDEQRDHVGFYAHMRLERHGELVGTLLPARIDFNDYSMLRDGRPDPLQIRSNIFIRSNPLEDVYVALLNFEEGGRAGAFKFTILPFTWWLWFGGLVLIFGTLVCLWPERDREGPRNRRRRDALLWRGVVLGLLLTLWIPIGPQANAQLPPDAAIPAQQEEEIDPHHGESVPEATEDWMRNAGADAYRAFGLVMTTCAGCAGKTLAIASPSCADSNRDKERIVALTQQGLGVDEILAVFVEERGESALAIPPNHGVNRLAWFVPVMLLGFGVFLIAFLVRRWRRQGEAAGIREGTRDDEGVDEEDPHLRQLRDELAMES